MTSLVMSGNQWQWTTVTPWRLRIKLWSWERRREGGDRSNVVLSISVNHWQGVTALQGIRHLPPGVPLPHTEDMTSSRRYWNWSVLSPLPTCPVWGAIPRRLVLMPVKEEWEPSHPTLPAHDPSKYRPVSNNDGPSGSLTVEPSLTIRLGGVTSGNTRSKRKEGLAIHTHFPTGSKMGKDSQNKKLDIPHDTE